ncbi:hypothetical protein I6U48_00910 [Clostridium sp. PL3]|uniref:HNH endonuclease n=1 Tax=Clostridium thailandense TaxID=2794346 RepID=A0A949TU86_9CLOT|nr:HNH endonuclease domain-containing protein [Clostridium thailandense]MBV7271480.1 hypothetical protein [Clostridium thailandense]
MIRIELSGEIEEKHIQYFKSNIIPKLIDSRRRSYIHDTYKAANMVKKDCFLFKKKFIKQHNYFIGFVKNKYKIFAAGKPSELKKLKDQIYKLFPLVISLIKSGYKNNKDQMYGEYLYNLFGYEDFKVKDLYYYIKKKAQENSKKNKYCKEVRYEMVRLLNFNYPNLNKEINNRLSPRGKELSANEFEKEFRKLSGINITMDNFKQIDIFKEEWNDYAFIMETGIRVCPYCNRQYITPVFSDNGKMRADIDHFLSKSKHPYFSMSLYNLVPVCKSCNQSLKGAKEFEFDDINPYEYNLNDYFTFRADALTNEILIDGIHVKTKEITKHLNTFKIEPLYNYHQNQIDELIKKRIAYPESYIEKLYNDNKDYFNDVSEVKQLIIGYINDKSKLNDEAFLKLRRDVADQLGFLNSKIDDVQIEKLKIILNKRRRK